MRHRRPGNDEERAWLAERLCRSDYQTYFDNLDADEGRF